MQIYHTETQADYDALMVELESKGIQTLKEYNWKLHSSETCVRVDEKMAMYDKKSYYTQYYPDTPIIKYK